MSPAINEELLVLAMCAYGGLVLMVCYDAHIARTRSSSFIHN